MLDNFIIQYKQKKRLTWNTSLLVMTKPLALQTTKLTLHHCAQMSLKWTVATIIWEKTWDTLILYRVYLVFSLEEYLESGFDDESYFVLSIRGKVLFFFS